MIKEKQIIELYENSNQLILDAIDRIVVDIRNKKDIQRKSQTILVTGCSPLSGTTSTCIGLSIALANAKWKTLLVDCDVRKSTKYKKLNQETSTGLGDFLIADDSNSLAKDIPTVNDIIYKTNIENLSFIPCGGYTDNSTRILCSQQMNKLLSEIVGQFDYVIFDFPSLTVAPDAQILFSVVDGIILIAATGETTKKQIKDAKRKVGKYEDHYYGMIVNKLDLTLYRRDVRGYDYYFINKKGEQVLKGNSAKKYRRVKGKSEYDKEKNN